MVQGRSGPSCQELDICQNPAKLNTIGAWIPKFRSIFDVDSGDSTFFPRSVSPTPLASWTHYHTHGQDIVVTGTVGRSEQVYAHGYASIIVRGGSSFGGIWYHDGGSAAAPSHLQAYLGIGHSHIMMRPVFRRLLDSSANRIIQLESRHNPKWNLGIVHEGSRGYVWPLQVCLSDSFLISFLVLTF